MICAYFIAICLGAQEAAPAIWIDHPDFPKALQEKALQATLRLKNPQTNGEGTAVRIKRIGPWTYYLTAAHVVGPAKAVNLEAFNPATYPKADAKLTLVDVWRVFPDKDLAILRGVEPNPGPCINVTPEDRIPASFGFPALTLGCSGGLAPTIVLDKVRDRKRVHKPNGTVGWYWEAEKPPVVGRSGGPMIEKNGFLIGICSGTSDKIGYYVDAKEIRSLLAAETRLLLETDEEKRK